MRLTIIPDDKAVYVDGEAMDGLDMSSIDPTIHAVQWDGTRGEIEYRSVVCSSCHGVSRKPNSIFTDVTPYQPFVDAFNVEKAARAATAAAEAETLAAANAAAAQAAQPPVAANAP
jgi:hypothetical protein